MDHCLWFPQHKPFTQLTMPQWTSELNHFMKTVLKNTDKYYFKQQKQQTDQNGKHCYCICIRWVSFGVFTSICPFSVVVWHRGSLKGRIATAGLGSVGGYLEPLQGIHLTWTQITTDFRRGQNIFMMTMYLPNGIIIIAKKMFDHWTFNHCLIEGSSFSHFSFLTDGRRLWFKILIMRCIHTSIHFTQHFSPWSRQTPPRH